MKKSIVKLGLVTALSASLFGFTYEIKQGWQQLGALEDLNSTDLKVFNDKCVNYLWFYDNNDSSNPQWKLHIANGNDYDYCGEELKSLKKGQGFWANAKADCNISIGKEPNVPCVSDMPAPPDLEKPECMTCNTDNNESNNSQGTISYKGISYKEVISPFTGRTWLDKNLGASQVCTSSNDTLCYGDYYQWGREADGHEKSNSEVTNTQANDITNVGNKYINVQIWTSIDKSGSLRSANWKKTDGTGICPIGYRVPSREEFEQEFKKGNINSTDLAFKSFLKLGTTGNRVDTGVRETQFVYLWTNWNAENAFIDDKRAATSIHIQSYGMPIRCIKN